MGEQTPSTRAHQEVAKIRNDLAAAEVIAELDRVGITSILLKGPSIAGWLYDADEARTYGDVDLIVSPDDYAAAGESVATLGFRHLDLGSPMSGQPNHHETWFRELDGAALELHRTLYGVTRPDDVLWRALRGRTEILELGIGGATARVLDPVARAFFLALHAAAHGSGVVKPINDLERGLERLPADLWQKAALLASELGAVESFVLGLTLARGGDAVISRSGLSRRASSEARLRASSPPPTALGFAWLAQTQGLRQKVALLRREFFPPADFMRVTYAIGRRGPLGLVCAYVLRPLRLIRQAPSGYRAYRKARGPARE